MDNIKEMRKNLNNEFSEFIKKPHPYASLTSGDIMRSDVDAFDPIVKISNPHNPNKLLVQPDLDLAEYYYESMNDMNEGDIDTDLESTHANVIDVTTDCGQSKKLIFDTPQASPSPLPFELQEEVNLNFYKILDEEDTDPRRKEVRKVIEIYNNPPPIPKRVDSIARNIDQYFTKELVRQANKEDLVLQIEREILNLSPTESDDEFVSDIGNEHDETMFPEVPPPPFELNNNLPHDFYSTEDNPPIPPPPSTDAYSIFPNANIGAAPEGIKKNSTKRKKSIRKEVALEMRAPKFAELLTLCGQHGNNSKAVIEKITGHEA